MCLAQLCPKTCYCEGFSHPEKQEAKDRRSCPCCDHLDTAWHLGPWLRVAMPERAAALSKHSLTTMTVCCESSLACALIPGAGASSSHRYSWKPFAEEALPQLLLCWPLNNNSQDNSIPFWKPPWCSLKNADKHVTPFTFWEFSKPSWNQELT